MKVRFYGTRGSVPVSRPDVVKTGGNTTCLRVFSDSLPKGSALVIDAGSGYVECSKDLLKEEVMSVSLLFTHWHHDHTMGLPLAPHTFIPTARIKIWGPKEHGVGPVQVFTTLMQAPFFPVEFAKLRHRFKLHDLEHVGNEVLVIHPAGGYKLLPIHIVNQARADGKQISIGGSKYEL
jgi:phosphoribosyl 1,2-cyclic phosphodiesterase